MTGSAASVARYIGKAERALEEARLLLGNDKTEGACSRAYYAMHDAAHAALFATGDETQDAIIKTHLAEALSYRGSNALVAQAA